MSLTKIKSKKFLNKYFFKLNFRGIVDADQVEGIGIRTIAFNKPDAQIGQEGNKKEGRINSIFLKIILYKRKMLKSNLWMMDFN